MKIGLALGGGGVRGFAHVPVLKALDDLGLKPSIIAGTSMGAIIGSMYASGLSGDTLLKLVHEHAVLKDDSWRDIYEKRDSLLEWMSVFTPARERGGIIKAAGLFKLFLDEINCDSFEQLEIPLIIIAADYWSAEEVVFEQGELLPAIQASMAVPGVYAPVCLQDRVLIDGGVVNLVPYDHVASHCDITIAVDVGGSRHPDETPVPNIMESLLGTIDVMQKAMLNNKMQHQPPDIFIHPEIRGIRMMDFTAIEEVLEQSQAAVDELTEALSRLLNE